jgi:hypothetical protein
MHKKSVEITVLCLDGVERKVPVPSWLTVELAIVRSIILHRADTGEELSLVRDQEKWQEVSKSDLEAQWRQEALATAEEEAYMLEEAELEAAEANAQSEELEQACVYLNEQGFEPRRAGDEWQIIYPTSGRPGTLTDAELIEKAEAVRAYHALHPVLRSNPTIGKSHLL